MMRDLEEIRRQVNANRVQFIKVELDLAITFVSVALDDGLDEEKRRRNFDYARTAYETITRFVKDVDLSPVEKREIEPKLQQIKTALEQMVYVTDNRELYRPKGSEADVRAGYIEGE